MNFTTFITLSLAMLLLAIILSAANAASPPGGFTKPPMPGYTTPLPKYVPPPPRLIPRAPLVPQFVSPPHRTPPVRTK